MPESPPQKSGDSGSFFGDAMAGAAGGLITLVIADFFQSPDLVIVVSVAAVCGLAAGGQTWRRGQTPLAPWFVGSSVASAVVLVGCAIILLERR